MAIGSARLSGAEVALTYLDGVLTRAVLRGNGREGEDVTDNLRTIGSVPLLLRPPGTITESRANELVRFKLDFIKPMKANNTAEFTFQPERTQTVVTWTMAGKNNFIGKAFGLFVDCDKMVGGDFEKGLAQLKSIAETAKP